MGITSRVAGTAAAIGLTLALVGCAGSNSATPKALPSPADNGVAALSAQEILAASQNAVVKARSFTGTGTTYEGGKQYPLSLKASDTGFHFKLGNQYEFTVVPNAVYLKLQGEILASVAAGNAKVSKAVAGKWFKLDDPSQFGLPANLTAAIKETLKPTGAISKAGQKTIDGKPTIGIKDEGEAAGPEDDSILYVATTGDPLPLAIEAVGPKADTGTFSDFGAAIEVTAPAPSQVVTTNDLGQLG